MASDCLLFEQKKKEKRSTDERGTCKLLAAVASIGSVDAVPPNVLCDHFCIPDARVPCTSLDPATFSAGAPHVIPCKECYKIDATGNLWFPAGLDVHGKLVFEDDPTF